MAKEIEDTKPEVEGQETEDEAADREAEEILARANGKKPTGGVTDEDEVDEVEVEAGVSDTVSRAELIKAIKRRQASAKKAREIQAELDELRRTSETEGEKAVREATDKVTRELTGKYKPALIKTAAEAALLAANPKKGKAGIPRLIKLMDLDAIEVTDELDLEGVEDEVIRLQEEFPELFGETSDPDPEDKEIEEKKTTRRRVTSRSQDGAGKKAPPVKKSTSEIIMAKLRGDDI